MMLKTSARTTDFTTLVRAALASGERDTDKITRVALAACLDSDDPEQALYKAVRAYTSQVRRTYVADKEIKWEQAERLTDLSADLPVFPPPTYRGEEIPYINPAMAARLELSLETFDVPGFGMVEWGKATVEQHELAIKAARMEIAGHQSHIDRHELMIQKITEAGVTCMNEIDN